jgi:hypothetical protein
MSKVRASLGWAGETVLEGIGALLLGEREPWMSVVVASFAVIAGLLWHEAWKVPRARSLAAPVTARFYQALGLRDATPFLYTLTLRQCSETQCTTRVYVSYDARIIRDAVRREGWPG